MASTLVVAAKVSGSHFEKASALVQQLIQPPHHKALKTGSHPQHGEHEGGLLQQLLVACTQITN